MTELVSILLILAILAFLTIGLGLSGGGGYVWKASETDPFEGRHFHIVTRPDDPRPEDCPDCPDYPECSNPVAKL